MSPMKFNSTKDLIIFDVETSGTTAEASVIQIGAVRFSRDGHVTKDTFSLHIIPYTDHWNPSAERIHKLTREYLMKHGYRLEMVLESFEDWIKEFTDGDLKQVYLAQWGCGFDTSMLQNAYRHIHRKYPFHYRSFDIASVVRFYMMSKGLMKKKCGEIKCAQALGIESNPEWAHDGLYDAKLAGQMLEKVLEAYSG